MNVAFLLAVDTYKDELNSLPVCKKDFDAIKMIIELSKKFDKVIDLGGSDEGSIIQKRLRENVQALDNSEIDELFFYFSGHGEIEGELVNLLLSDYSQRRRSQTSISSDLIDNIARELQPKVFVKLIDACNSGIAYVKKGDFIPSFTSLNKLPLNVFFGSSSLTREESFFGDELSYFTESIVSAVCDHPNGDMKYYELAAAVKDYFTYRTKQTPLFIEQGVSNQSFCYVTDQLKEDLRQFIKSDQASIISADAEPSTKSLIDRIKSEAKKYADRDIAQSILSSIEIMFSEGLKLHGDLEETYEFDVESSDGHPPSPQKIGEWLFKSGTKYMARTEWQEQDPASNQRNSGILGLPSYSNSLYNSLRTTQTVRNIVSYEITTRLKPNLITISAMPKFRGLQHCEMFIVPFVSETMVAFSYAFTHMLLRDFNTYTRAQSCSWHFVECQIVERTETDKALKAIMSQFIDFVEEPIRARYMT